MHKEKNHFAVFFYLIKNKYCKAFANKVLYNGDLKKDNKNMKHILKWHGSKGSELEIIHKNKPSKINRFIEPFLGSGAVYFSLEHTSNIVNDFHKELMNFYSIINNQKNFSIFKYIIEQAEEERRLARNITDLEHIYDEALLINNTPMFHKYLVKELKSKEKTIKKINIKNGSILSDNEILQIKITGVCAALYYMYRELYNLKNKSAAFDAEHLSYWFIMREICYSGMFRFSAKGNFNVPYGGLSYNTKTFSNKLKQIDIMKDKSFFNNTEFNNLDFESFFVKYDFFKKDDFIFLDPPYDSEFSQYNIESDFTKMDHIRLRNSLLKTKANIMMVIKNTDFIYQLYKDNFKIQIFDKSYNVNFKNRNNRDTQHLIITNY